MFALRDALSKIIAPGLLSFYQPYHIISPTLPQTQFLAAFTHSPASANQPSPTETLQPSPLPPHPRILVYIALTSLGPSNGMLTLLAGTQAGGPNQLENTRMEEWRCMQPVLRKGDCLVVREDVRFLWGMTGAGGGEVGDIWV